MSILQGVTFEDDHEKTMEKTHRHLECWSPDLDPYLTVTLLFSLVFLAGNFPSGGGGGCFQDTDLFFFPKGNCFYHKEILDMFPC